MGFPSLTGRKSYLKNINFKLGKVVKERQINELWLPHRKKTKKSQKKKKKLQRKEIHSEDRKGFLELDK